MVSPKQVIQIGLAVVALIVFFVLTLATGNQLESAAIAIGGGFIASAVLNNLNKGQPDP